MDQTYHLFLLCPGAHGKIRKVHLPLFAVRVILGLALTGVVGVAALANNYLRLLLKVSNYNALRAEREALKTQGQNLEDAIVRSNLKLESLQSLAAEVALAYTFSDSRRPQLPAEVLHVASRGLVGMGSDYAATLCAFNMMKVTPLLTSYSSRASFAVLDGAYQDDDIPSLWPVRGRITAGFGERMDPFTGEDEFHKGVDIAASTGTPVRVSANGILLHAGPEGTYGIEALIDHGYGVSTKYAHLSALYVKVGEEVARGQVIGAVGVTGRTTGPHLHYEVLVHGQAVNPAAYLRE